MKRLTSAACKLYFLALIEINSVFVVVFFLSHLIEGFRRIMSDRSLRSMALGRLFVSRLFRLNFSCR